MSKINDRAFVELLRNSKQQVRREAADRLEALLDEIDTIKSAQNTLMPYDSDGFKNAVLTVVKESLSVSIESDNNYVGCNHSSGEMWVNSNKLIVCLGDVVITEEYLD